MLDKKLEINPYFSQEFLLTVSVNTSEILYISYSFDTKRGLSVDGDG